MEGGGDGAQALVVATLEHGLEVTDAMMKFAAFSRVERKQLVQLACAQHIETVRQKLVMAKWKAYVHEIQKYRNFQLAVFTRFDLFK